MKLAYQDLGQGITCIETYYQRAGLACCYLMQQQDEAALIDTGTARSVPLVMGLLAKRNIAPEQVRYVIPTHVHLDHAGGTGQLMELLPEATLVVHPYGARHMIDPAKLTAGTIGVYGEEQFKRDYDRLLPVAAERVQEAPDGFRLSLGNRQLECIDTPGHARHHMCIWDELSRGFFTGDTFGIAYPELATDRGPFMYLPSTPVQFDPKTWHQTIDRLIAFEPERMYLTHYGSVEQPVPLAETLHQELDDYVEIANGSDPEARYDSLVQGLRSYYAQRLQQHGCRLAPERIEEILAMDYGLCAQGLEVWLQRQHP